MKEHPGADGGAASEVLTLLRRRGPLSRIELLESTGLARSTVNQRLAGLLEAGLVEAVGSAASTGGRPSTTFAFNADRARVLVADVGASGLTVALCDLHGRPLRWRSATIDVAEGPDAVLGTVGLLADELVADEQVWAFGVGVPGPVEFAAGRVVQPPIMTGWDGYDIAGALGARYGTPVVVENDVNARAIAWARTGDGQPDPHNDDIVFMKLGTGIGAGLFFNGEIIRGSLGAAGDIGHTYVANASQGDSEPVCRCGNQGCVEAYAGGWALVRDLREAGVSVTDVSDVVARALDGNVTAVQLVRRAGRIIGGAVSTLVSVLNPSSVVIGGQLARCAEMLLSGIRERVYQRAQPLATKQLRIEMCLDEPLIGARGLALIAVDRALEGWQHPQRIDA